MTKWAEIMPVKRRLELLKYADERHIWLTEDDFENEFVYFQKPTPSLFGLSGRTGRSLHWFIFQIAAAFYPYQLYDPAS